jgi:cellulase
MHISETATDQTQGNVNPAKASGKCAFEAGDTVTIEMHQHNDRLCTTEGIGGAHWGPVLAYMGKVEDAASADGSGEFFKVYQNGWAKAPGSTQGDNDFWGTKDLNYNCKSLQTSMKNGMLTTLRWKTRLQDPLRHRTR